MNFIAKNFIRGLAIVVPFVVTAYVLYQTFVWIDGLIALPAPGLGVLVTFAGIVLVGILASNFVIRKVLELVELIFTRAPLVKIIYTSIKDLTVAFVGDRKRFNRPVLVTLGEGGQIQALGFVTCDELSFAGLEERVAVYLPQSYNVAGNLLFVPRGSVTPLDVDSTRMMAFIVSGGVTGVPDQRSARAS